MSKHRDPVTGDELTTGEYVSWLIQGVIRRWTFLILVTVGTAVCWATRDPNVLLWWNLVASFLAIVIESIVGLAMFGQTRRDAVCLREVRTISRRVEELATLLVKDVERIESDIEPPPNP